MSISRRRLIAMLGSIPVASALAPALETPTGASALPAPTVLPLYPGAAPGAEHWTQQEIYHADGDNHIFRNVTHPALLAITFDAKKLRQ